MQGSCQRILLCFKEIPFECLSGRRLRSIRALRTERVAWRDAFWMKTGDESWTSESILGIDSTFSSWWLAGRSSRGFEATNDFSSLEIFSDKFHCEWWHAGKRDASQKNRRRKLIFAHRCDHDSETKVMDPSFWATGVHTREIQPTAPIARLMLVA